MAAAMRSSASSSSCMGKATNDIHSYEWKSQKQMVRNPTEDLNNILKDKYERYISTQNQHQLLS
eukprot:scaffold43198_cov18-Prasinocladus_malaysianus.AAC.1